MAKATKKVSSSKTTISQLLENPSTVHALAYIPWFIGPVAMYFLATSDKKVAMHHIKYSALIAVAAIVLVFVLNTLFTSIVHLLYLGLSGFMAFKAYKWEKIQIEILDTIEEKISEKVKK